MKRKLLKIFLISSCLTLGNPLANLLSGPFLGVMEASALTPAAAPVKPATTTPAGSLVDPFAKLRSGVKRIVLSNGLRVMMYHRDEAPIFAGNTWVKVGGVNEVVGNTGIAHLLEHMAFKGTDKIGTKDYQREKVLLARLEELIPGATAEQLKERDAELKRIYAELETLWIDNEFAKIYNENGAANLNAATAKDYTTYTISLPKNAFELWCWMESERLKNAVFRQFYKERDVVQEERRSRVEDDPDGKLYEALLLTAYRSHPNRLPVVGWPSDLKTLTATANKAFYDTYYRPDNIVLGVVGDIDLEKAEILLEKYFGNIPVKTTPLPQVTNVEEQQQGEREAIVEFDAEPSLMMAYHKPVYPDLDDLYFSVLHSVLAEGRSSVMHRELVRDRHIASSVYTTEAPGELFPSLFVVGGSPRDGVTSAQLRDEIQKILDRLKTQLISEEDLRAAKRRVLVSFLSGVDSNSGLADMLARYEVLHNDWQLLFKMYDVVQKTTPEDLRNLANKYLNVSNRTYVYVKRPAEKQSAKQQMPGAERAANTGGA